MKLAIKSASIGSNAPEVTTPDKILKNGNFTITSNTSSNKATGDGKNESTEWDFDFKNHINWNSFSKNEKITSAKLILTSSPKVDLATDVIKINFGDLGNMHSTGIRLIPIGETKTIEIDMLSSGYSSNDILNVLNNNNGIIPMQYHDDSIISFAELEICQEVNTCCDRLIVEAISEDTIASPGNRKPNYLLVSVTNANGMPITNLTKDNFEIDALIVGPGGALLNIDKLQHSSRIDGYYFLDLLPIKNETWKKGIYVIAVAVKHNNIQGQTLTSVLVD